MTWPTKDWHKDNSTCLLLCIAFNLFAYSQKLVTCIWERLFWEGCLYKWRDPIDVNSSTFFASKLLVSSLHCNCLCSCWGCWVEIDRDVEHQPKHCVMTCMWISKCRQSNNWNHIDQDKWNKNSGLVQSKEQVLQVCNFPSNFFWNFNIEKTWLEMDSG